MSALTLIFAILFALKAAGLTTISWGAVFLPILIPFAVGIILYVIAVLIRGQ